jgi:hypothetical protein
MGSIKTGHDAEIDAMATVGRALAHLDVDARRRVLWWAGERYGSGESLGGAHRGRQDEVTTTAGQFVDIASLYHSAKPKTQGQKVLTVGYWLQIIEGRTDLDAQLINAELKQLGHGVQNITSVFRDLMKAKPQLAMQVRKASVAKQARKKYRLTAEGIRAVNAMLAADSD